MMFLLTAIVLGLYLCGTAVTLKWLLKNSKETEKIVTNIADVINVLEPKKKKRNQQKTINSQSEKNLDKDREALSIYFQCLHKIYDLHFGVF